MSEKEIKEADKPFYLAIISSLITILCIILAGIGAALRNDTLANTAIEMLKYTFSLTTMAWAFYFKSK